MRTAIVALVTAIALVSSVFAGPRKVLVLPLDGNAPAAQKSQLNDSVAKMAKTKIDGDVTIGDTTFAETAAAVGCDPASADCAETVRSTLAVDELVYGSAKTDGGQTTVTVYRAQQGSAPTSQISVIAETDSGDKAEPGIEPVFTGVPATAAAAGSVEARRRPSGNFFDTRERKLGVGFAAGGVVLIAIGLSYWSAEGDLQDQIDSHPTRTLADLQSLQELEDRAGDKAMWGNILVGVGLGLGAVGGYFLYKDHQNRSTTLTPAPVEAGTGMTLVLGGHW